MSFAAASAVPPVAIRSSITSIFSPLLIESLWTSIVASPYSSLKSTECVSAGNLFFFLSKIKGLLSKYETVDAKTKPLDSIADTLSNSIFFDIFKIWSFANLKASGFLIKVVISLNKIPFFGWSLIDRICFFKSIIMLQVLTKKL